MQLIQLCKYTNNPMNAIMKMTIQDYQGFVRWQGGLQDRPESDFESVFQMSQGGVLKDYDDESGFSGVDNDDYNYERPV